MTVCYDEWCCQRPFGCFMMLRRCLCGWIFRSSQHIHQAPVLPPSASHPLVSAHLEFSSPTITTLGLESHTAKQFIWTPPHPPPPKKTAASSAFDFHGHQDHIAVSVVIAGAFPLAVQYLRGWSLRQSFKVGLLSFADQVVEIVLV